MANASFNPFMFTVTLADTTLHPLATLINALATKPTFAILPSGVMRACGLVISNDIDNAAAKLYIGNSNITTSLYGKKLIAGQDWSPGSFESNLINLNNIYLLTDTNPTVVAITITTR